MDFAEYQEKAKTTALYPRIAGQGYFYPTLGLAGETGEVVEKVKKLYRDQSGAVPEEKRREIAKELGDVLWYLSQLATELGLSLDAIAAGNIEKLASRKDRGALHGDGDNR